MMFAPDQAATADEIVRVCAPDGRICLTTWRPDGGVGRFFKFMRSYQPPPAEAAGNPMEWGRERLHHSFVEWAEMDRDGDMIRQSRTYLLTTGTRHNR